MKLADRKPTEFHSAVRDPRVEACIKAREREALDLEESKSFAIICISRVGYQLTEVNADRSLDANRALLGAADAQLTAIRGHIASIRRHCKTIADRDAREENGVLKP